MKKYAIHSASIDTDDIEVMKVLYPKAALYASEEYGGFYLFAQPMAHPTLEVVDMSSMGDTPRFRELSFYMMTHQTGRWVLISPEQANYLQVTYFPREEEDGDSE